MQFRPYYLLLNLLLALSVSFSPCFAFAQKLSAPPGGGSKMAGILINADSMERDSDTENMVLEGHVQIVYQGQHITADRAIANLRSRRLELTGHVEVVSQKSTMGGESIRLDYETNTGLIYDGFVQSGSVMFEGRLLEKTGEDEYFVSDADYTACTNCPSTWSFTGGTIRAELGGYAYIRNSIMRVGVVPIFWFPYLIVPLKSDRQSGLLTPGFENSNNGGLAFAQPYFWAINRSSDATITAKTYELRGPKGLGEYRFVPNENSYGELDGAFLRDHVFKDDSRVTEFEPDDKRGEGINRWFLRYQDYLELPGGYVQRANLNTASDLQYAKDFPLETLNFGDSAMENRVSLTKDTQNQHFSVEGDYYINNLHSNPLSNNDDAVHRLPEVRFSQTTQNIGKSDWNFNIDLDYVDFTRAGPGYDELTPVIQTPNNGNLRTIKTTCSDDPTKALTWDQYKECQRIYSGSYDPANDLIRTGQRMDFQPSISRPFKPVEGVDITPKISYRETDYEFNVGPDPTNSRRYIRTELDNRMTFSSIYGDLNDPKADRYKHEIIPEVIYTKIPWLDHRSHPFFGTGEQTESPSSSATNISDGDLASNYGMQFDYNDRIYDRDLVTFALTNKIVEKHWVNDKPEYKQVALFQLSQSYDAYQASNGPVEDRQPWSDVAAVVDIRLDHFSTYSTFNYFPDQNVTNTSSRMRFINDHNQFLQLGLTKQYDIVPGQVVDSRKRVEDYTFASGFVSKYINLMGEFVYNANYANAQNRDNKIKSWAYIAQFKPPGDCWLITFIQDQVTGGDTNLRFAFEFSFDGQPRPPLPPDALDQFGF